MAGKVVNQKLILEKDVIQSIRSYSFYFYVPNYLENSNGAKIIWQTALEFSKFSNVSIYNYESDGSSEEPFPHEYKELVTHKGPKNNDIIVYPDCIEGNPLEANKVVKFMLCRQYLLNSLGAGFKKKDYVIAYSKTVSKIAPQLHIVSHKLLNLSKYHSIPKKNKVSIYYGKCRLALKNKNIKKLLNHFEEVSILTRSSPKNKDDLYKEIAESMLLISIDPNTNLTHESTLIGTPVYFADGVFKEANDNFNHKHYGYYYDANLAYLSDILDPLNINELKLQTMKVLKNHLASQEKRVRESIASIIDYFERDNCNVKLINLIEEDDKSFYSDKWKCSQTISIKGNTHIIVFHLLRKYPALYPVLKSIYKILKTARDNTTQGVMDTVTSGKLNAKTIDRIKRLIDPKFCLALPRMQVTVGKKKFSGENIRTPKYSSKFKKFILRFLWSL
tara:strand:+ start:2447 stop:3787 length:1341 start_codon:yes stop_codon:yes gene_type:complete